MAPWFKNWETKPVHSAQCRHVVVCTHQIRRKRTWESLLKTIWYWESQPYQVSNMNHTLSKLPIKFNLLVARFAAVLEQELYCCFFSRFVVHQIMLQSVLFIRGLSCAKSCSNACFFSRLVVHQIVLQCVLFFRGFSWTALSLFDLSFTREAWLPQKGFDRRSRHDVGRWRALAILTWTDSTVQATCQAMPHRAPEQHFTLFARVKVPK